MTVTRTYRFHEVFEEEVQAVNQRRRRFRRAEVALELEPDVNSPSDARAEGEPIMRPTVGSGLAGLALSGGGIRSASFCLGALQALDRVGVLKHIDYLSTVSGGGYIGTSLSAAMTHSKGDFPFTSSLTQDEPYPVQHIRNHSIYFFPLGSITIFPMWPSPPWAARQRPTHSAVVAGPSGHHNLPQTGFGKPARHHASRSV